jgi:hypothetical protein
MGEPMAKGLDSDGCLFEFVCSRCGVTELLPLVLDVDSPRCRCGFPLWPLAEARRMAAAEDICGERFLAEIFEERGPSAERPPLVQRRGEDAGVVVEADSDYGPLDHPHSEPHCGFCAVRQLHPSQHRLWCRVFLHRECSCGYDRR